MTHALPAGRRRRCVRIDRLDNHVLLADQLTQALATTRLALIVDMTAVDFCDSTGLNVFARVLRETQARGLTLLLTGLHGRVAHAFAITRLDHAIHTKPTSNRHSMTLSGILRMAGSCGALPPPVGVWGGRG